MIANTSDSASLAATITAVETEYPDWSFVPDPEPVEDGMQQEPTLFRILPMLKAHFHNREDALVAGAGFLCYDRSNLERAACAGLHGGVRRGSGRDTAAKRLSHMGSGQAAGSCDGSCVRKYRAKRYWAQARSVRRDGR